MWSYAKLGWSTARSSWFLLSLLFLYQFAWGMVLYDYVKGIAVPLLHRYPGGDWTESANRLFWLEAQFQLMKTDLIMPYLWVFAFFLIARMVITPLINGGLLSAVHSGKKPQRKAFFQGIRQFAKPFLLLYLLQALLTFAPLLWVVPHVFQAIAGAAQDPPSLALAVLPWVFGWLAYQGLLDLAFLYICFGIVSGKNVWSSLFLFFRRMLPITCLALLLFLILGAIGLLTATVSIWWAGFFAVLIHQSYPFIRVLLKLWGICSQYHLWSSASQYK